MMSDPAAFLRSGRAQFRRSWAVLAHPAQDHEVERLRRRTLAAFLALGIAILPVRQSAPLCAGSCPDVIGLLSLAEAVLVALGVPLAAHWAFALLGAVRGHRTGAWIGVCLLGLVGSYSRSPSDSWWYAADVFPTQDETRSRLEDCIDGHREKCRYATTMLARDGLRIDGSSDR